MSPPLHWSGAPEGTRSCAIVCHDPDAPLVANGRYGFVHWILYRLPAAADGLEEDTDLGVAGLDLRSFLEQVELHLIGMNRLVATYQRE